jgi:NAD+ kinase
MPSSYHSIALTARVDFEEKENVLKRIVSIVEMSGARVCIDKKTCAVPSLQSCETFSELKDFDLIIVVGGDGTILRTVREMQDFSPPLLTINRGTMGFLTECSFEECETMLPKFLKGAGHIEERQMLQCYVNREEKQIITGHALNDIVVSQSAIARLIKLKTEINGVPLATFRADGVIIATPTGSTAYNLAAGGPILHPASCDTIITPINAHGFTQKPLAVPSSSLISVEVDHRDSSYENIRIGLTLDGQAHHEIKKGDRVIVTAHNKTVKFLKGRKDAFYETLRTKLGWGE